MFKKGKLQRVTALMLCAAALCACLAGCTGEREGPSLPGFSPSGETTPAPESPAELLSSALDGARADLEARLSASLLAGLSGLSSEDSLSAQVDIAFPDEGGEPLGSLAGGVVFNASTGEARADLTVSTDGTPLGIYYGPEFLGVSCQKVFGDGTFYGLRPYGLAEQLNGSPLAELVELDMEAVAELDELLASVPRDVNVFAAPEADRMFRAAHELIRELDLTSERTTLTRGGRELDGTSFRAVISAGDLADFLKHLAAALPEWVLAYGIGTGDDSAAAVDEAVESIRQSGVETPVTFTVAEGKLCHVSAEYTENGSTTRVEAELYGDNGQTVLVTVEPWFSLTLDLADGVSADLQGSGGTTTRLRWASDHSFEFITYQNDVTDLCLDGTLTAEEGRLSFDGIWYSGERGDRNTLRLSTTPDGEIAAPETTRSLADLSTRELYTALMKAVFNLFK